MLELSGSSLVFHFPDVHPCARVTISFERTLRIPDDEKTYQLPPSLGSFPVRHVEDFQARLPEKWKKRGGVMLPMYQSEAMWLNFRGHQDPERGTPYPFAIKVAAGKQSALTGEPWSKKLKERDYCVIPLQPWLDGYVVDKGLIRQFVAMPLGGGFSVEEQLTGKAEFGGLQIEAIPMRRSEYERRFPKRPPPPPSHHGLLRSMSLGSHSGGARGGQWTGPQGSVGPTGHTESGSRAESGPARRLGATYSLHADRSVSLKCSVDRQDSCMNSDSGATLDLNSMGLGAGGLMKQQVFDDPYALSDWETESKTRCFVHLADSMTWRAITSEAPPTVPLTAEDYTRHGRPWFDYYAEEPALKGTKALKGVKTVKEVGHAKGIPALPENTSVSPTHVHVIPASTFGGKQVRDGVWK